MIAELESNSNAQSFQLTLAVAQDSKHQQPQFFQVTAGNNYDSLLNFFTRIACFMLLICLHYDLCFETVDLLDIYHFFLIECFLFLHLKTYKSITEKMMH